LILSNSEKKQIQECVQDIESRVFGEILVVVCPRVTPVAWLSWVLPALVSWMLLALVSILTSGGGFDFFSDPQEQEAYPGLWLLGAWLFGACLGWVLSRFSPLQKIFIPDSMESRFVQKEALSYFFSHGVSHTPSQSGVLIFISLFEREMDIIVDKALREKITREDLNQIIQTSLKFLKKGHLASGILSTVRDVGYLLETHFQKPETKPNEVHEELLIVGSSWD
jgi:putative membrane protein